MNQANNEPETPLHSAARTGQTNVVQLLLEYGANIGNNHNNGLITWSPFLLGIKCLILREKNKLR